jgi:SOS-response transcriptional repressor LexA/DNA-binding XRE family transcriptional regulator
MPKTKSKAQIAELTGLYYARKSRALTQPDLAKLGQTTKQQVGRLESGAVELTRTWADRFAPHLGYTSEQILYWDLYFDDEGKPLDRAGATRARLSRILRSAGQKLAARLKNNPHIRDFLAAKAPTLTSDFMAALTDAAGGDIARQVTEGNLADVAQPGGIASIPVIGVAEAGAFREMVEFGDEHELPHIAAPRSAQYPLARHLAFEVRGDSMNASKPPIAEGAYALCVDVIDAGLTLETGEVYVVRRALNGGHGYEWTVKRAKVFRDRIELHPESTNQSHKPVTIPRKHDADTTGEVVAVGWVYGLYTPLGK